VRSGLWMKSRVFNPLMVQDCDGSL
jgi:hypothetical protein